MVHPHRGHIDETLTQLRIALLAGGILLAIIAVVVARLVARGILAPVDEAARTAARIAHGDLGARVPVTSDDEFGVWAAQFNEMVDTLAETIVRLEAAQAQNRAFVADVSHELRTPVAALVAEVSILRDHLDALPPEARRTGELVVQDVGRMRVLVEDLMELSRFDAAGEEVRIQPVDLNRLIRDTAAARHRDAVLELPDDRVSSTPTRAAWSGSSATSSTTPASTRRTPSSSSGSSRLAATSGSPSPTAGPACRPTGSTASSIASSWPIRRAAAAAAWSRHRGGARGAPRRRAARARNREGGGLALELDLPVTESVTPRR